jgi:hypothetical protein
LVAALVAVGCASSSARPPGGASAYGVWHFVEPILESRPAVVLEGNIVLQPDTLFVESTEGPCTYDPHSRDNRNILYRCGDVHFSFDRRNPLRENSYSMTTTVMVAQTSCILTTVDSKGVERCARTGTDHVAQSVRRSGTLRPMRR